MSTIWEFNNWSIERYFNENWFYFMVLHQNFERFSGLGRFSGLILVDTKFDWIEFHSIFAYKVFHFDVSSVIFIQFVYRGSYSFKYRASNTKAIHFLVHFLDCCLKLSGHKFLKLFLLDKFIKNDSFYDFNHSNHRW